jgi:hypothetical protein
MNYFERRRREIYNNMAYNSDEYIDSIIVESYSNSDYEFVEEGL